MRESLTHDAWFQRLLAKIDAIGTSPSVLSPPAASTSTSPPSSAAAAAPRAASPSPPVHRLRFPKYDGADNPLGWLHKCEQFFRSQGTPASLQVWTTAFYLEGAAAQWYFHLKNHGEPS